MERDMELVRRILLWLEKQDGQMPQVDPPFSDVADDAYWYHCKLLSEAGFLTALNSSNTITAWQCRPIRLTWEGHEFLDAARNESVWSLVNDMLAAAELKIGLPMLTEVLRYQLQQRGILPRR